MSEIHTLRTVPKIGMKFLFTCFILSFSSTFTRAQSDAERIVQNQLDTYNAHDLEGFLATFCDSAKIYTLGNSTPFADGKESIAQVYGDLFVKSPNLRSNLVNRIVLGNKIIDHEEITGRNASNETLELVMIYITADGCISEAHSIRK